MAAGQAPEQAIHTVVQAKGVPVLAHPAQLQGLDDLLVPLKAAGLEGMEVHYAQYDAAVIEELAAVAERHHLLSCGGSDYHAAGNPGEPEPGSVGPPIETVTRLRTLLRRGSPLGSSAQAGEPQ